MAARIVQQAARHGKQRGRGFFRRCGKIEHQSARQSQRAGHQRPAGAHEGEQFQHVIKRFGRRRLQPSRHESGMRHQRIARLENLPRLRRGRRGGNRPRRRRSPRRAAQAPGRRVPKASRERESIPHHNDPRKRRQRQSASAQVGIEIDQRLAGSHMFAHHHLGGIAQAWASSPSRLALAKCRAAWSSRSGPNRRRRRQYPAPAAPLHPIFPRRRLRPGIGELLGGRYIALQNFDQRFQPAGE